MKRAQALQIGLPAVIVTVGLVTIGVANRSPQPQSHRASTSDTTNQSGPSMSPEITVNGEAVKLDDQGNATLNNGAGRTTVRKSDDRTTVTTVHPGGNTTTTSGNGNLNISIQSTSDNSGSSTFSQSQVFQDSNTSSSNSTSTTVNSNGSVTTH